MSAVIARGRKVALRRAAPHEARTVHRWLVDSDLTRRVLGAPLYPDQPLPDFDSFLQWHGPHQFDGTRPFDGRGFIIETDSGDAGFIAHDRINLLKDIVELDLWLAHGRLGGHGYGSEAIALLCDWLQGNCGVSRFLLRPSRRNVRALRAMRRAGFREAELPLAQMHDKLDLRTGRYADEVLLLRTLPLPRAALPAPAERTLVFVDSEFTRLESPRLLSVGAVSACGREFYCELDGDAADCSDFVRAHVLPLLEGAPQPAGEARARFADWLGTVGGPRGVTLVSDSGFDRWALAELLGSEDLPSGARWQRVPVAYEALDELARSLGLRRHHALDDARALRHAVLHPEH